MKQKTLIIIIVIFLAVFIGFFAITHNDIPEKAALGNPVPDIELIDANRNTLKLSDLKGSVIFVNFWSTWCTSCVDEIPSIEILFDKFSQNNKFRMVTIIFKDNETNVFNFMKQNAYSFPVYFNPDDSAARKFGITGVPETFIIDKKGILRNKIIGPQQWDSPSILNAMEALINEPV